MNLAETSHTVYVNGAARAVPAGSTVRDLVLALELHPGAVAVEVNRDLVPKREHTERVLAPEDRIEVVTLVGGG